MIPWGAFRMMGQVLTVPIGVAHEATHYLAASLFGCPATIEVERNGSHCWVDFDAASEHQRSLIALAPTIIGFAIAPVLWLLSPSLPTLTIGLVALGLFSMPSMADIHVAAGGSLEDGAGTEPKPTGGE